MASKKAAPKTRGPKPETLKVQGDWETAIGKAVKKVLPKRTAKITFKPDRSLKPGEVPEAVKRTRKGRGR